MTALPREPIESSVRFIRQREPDTCEIALILGSGLGEYADSLPARRILAASDIPHYPVSAVEGHEGKLVFAETAGKKLLVFQGRIHFYESDDLARVLHPVRVAAELGVKTLLITNAAGGINRRFCPGTLMAITDQIDLTLESLPGVPRLLSRRPLYDLSMINLLESLAIRRGTEIQRGVYAGVKGPSYETAAEIEMIRRLGGDAVGMSTVKEVLLASELGMRIVGISCITNMGTGIGSSRLNHAEVTEAANKVKREFASLISDFISAL